MFDALESEQYGTSLGRENGAMILYAMAVAVINENCCYRDPLGVFRTVSVEWDVSWKSISYGEILIVVCDGWRVRLPRRSELEDDVRSLELPRRSVRHVVEDEDGFHEDAFLGAVHGNSPGTGTWQTEVTVDGESITFKIDTGADVDVISHELYTGTFKHKPVHKVKKILRGPDGKPLVVRGYISCKLQKGEVSVRSDVYIVDGASALIGRASCKALGLVTLCIDSINSYLNLFSGLGEMPKSYRISLKPGAEPFAVTYPRSIPLPLMGRVKNELDRLETLEVITRITKPTDWCAPIVVVLKGEKIRICVDYTKLNNSVKRERHILPSVDHTLGQMAGAKVFTRLDANSGFHQIKLTDESKELTTFITPFGRYCYKRLPFGVSSGLEHYQSQVHQVLENLPGVTCLLDDIVVFGTTEEEHDLRLDNVLKKLSEAGVNKAKCSFKQSEIKFLGHIVGKDGVKGDPDKVAAITGMAEPTDVSQLRRFLGMINQMGKFLPNLAALTEPLRQLLSKKNEWFWGPAQVSAFIALKKAVSDLPVLALYDPSCKLKVTADSSSYGVGAVLSQLIDGQWHPVAFASRALTSTEARYAQVEKETLACTWACNRFAEFLLGVDFVLETDHNPLVTLLGSKSLDELPARIQRMRMRMMRFSYSVVHVPGKLLYTADALSRAPLGGTTVQE